MSDLQRESKSKFLFSADVHSSVFHSQILSHIIFDISYSCTYVRTHIVYKYHIYYIPDEYYNGNKCNRTIFSRRSSVSHSQILQHSRYQLGCHSARYGRSGTIPDVCTDGPVGRRVGFNGIIMGYMFRIDINNQKDVIRMGLSSVLLWDRE